VGGRIDPFSDKGSTQQRGCSEYLDMLGQRRLMALVLDAGGLIAVDRLDRTVGAMLRVAQQDSFPYERAGSRCTGVAKRITPGELGACTGRC